VSPRAAVVVAIVTAATGARADAPKPAAPAAKSKPATSTPATSTPDDAPRSGDDAPMAVVEAASDANLESIENRQGLTFTGSLGGGMLIGFGIKDSVGRGGAVSLRLGHVATRQTVITFGLDVAAALHRRGAMDTIHTNTNTNLLAGAQYYLDPSLWLRAAGGIGVYHGDQVELSNPKPGESPIGDVQLIGPSGLVGFGVDLLRFKSAVLGLEFSLSATINSQGVLLSTSAGLGVAFD